MWEAVIQQFPRYAILAGLFAMVVMIVLGVSTVITGRAALRRRLAEAAAAGQTQGQAATLRDSGRADAWSRLVGAIEKRGVSLLDTNNATLTAETGGGGVIPAPGAACSPRAARADARPAADPGGGDRVSRRGAVAAQTLSVRRSARGASGSICPISGYRRARRVVRSRSSTAFPTRST